MSNIPFHDLETVAKGVASEDMVPVTADSLSSSIASYSLYANYEQSGPEIVALLDKLSETLWSHSIVNI